MLAQPAQHKGSHPKEDWQIDFTQMPPNKDTNTY